jgi:hypothetical protein
MRWMITIILVFEAISRVISPPEVFDTKTMLITSIIGVICNIIMGLTLHNGPGHHHGHDHGDSHSHDHKHNHNDDHTHNTGTELETITTLRGNIFNLTFVDDAPQHKEHSHNGHKCSGNHGHSHGHGHDHGHKQGHSDHKIEDSHSHTESTKPHSHQHHNSDSDSSDEDEHGHKKGGCNHDNMNVRAALIHVIGKNIKNPNTYFKN